MYKVEDYYVFYNNVVYQVICAGWHFNHTCMFCSRFSFGYCIVCPLIYGFGLPFWYFQYFFVQIK